MKAQVPISVYILLCLIIGAVFMVLLLAMTGLGVASRFLHAILRPGLQLAELMKFGTEGLRASVIVVIGNGLFYGVIAFVVMLWLRRRQ